MSLPLSMSKADICLASLSTKNANLPFDAFNKKGSLLSPEGLFAFVFGLISTTASRPVMINDEMDFILPNVKSQT